ncbi:PEP/pyruvate-binding domain-containing protein [Paenibacillus psychroresistens]|nr:PEP/pyruvate-binding domain-containing protein [Paenibacillus psychroresistens]
MSVVLLDKAIELSSFGGKAFQLGSAVRSGLPVPHGYAISYDLVNQIVNGNKNAFKEIDLIIGNLTLPFAVRSSAIDEDGLMSSYAGIYKTILGINDATGLFSAINEIACSGQATQAIAYRKRLGLTAPSQVAVIIQQMVCSELSGVIFTRNPLTGMDERMIEACWGLGESIVSGRITPDRYTVNRGATSIEIFTGRQETAIYPAKEGGTKEVKLDSQGINNACLLENHIRQLDHLATRCEQIFGKDLDIEWAFSDNRLYLLQCRKITTRGGISH